MKLWQRKSESRASSFSKKEVSDLAERASKSTLNDAVRKLRSKDSSKVERLKSLSVFLRVCTLRFFISGLQLEADMIVDGKKIYVGNILPKFW